MVNYLAAFNIKGKLGLREKLVLGQAVSTWDSLSAREKQALALLADGLEYAEIADCMHISVNGVRAHIKNIYRKLNVTNGIQAAKIFWLTQAFL